MRDRLDVPSLVAGLVVIALGLVLLLDRLEVFDLRFAWLAPALAAAVGAVLLAAGLADASR